MIGFVDLKPENSIDFGYFNIYEHFKFHAKGYSRKKYLGGGGRGGGTELF